MRKLIIIALSLISSYSFAQFDVKRTKLKEYLASNNITYKIGDTITLGQGTALNGKFNYLQMGGFGNTMSIIASSMGSFNDGYAMGADRNMSGQKVIIKKIKQEKNNRGSEKVYFVVGMGNFTNGNLFIEDAIQTCEIKDCSRSVQDVNVVSKPDKYDSLKKIKELKDSGVLSQEEYEIEKSKVLKDN